MLQCLSYSVGYHIPVNIQFLYSIHMLRFFIEMENFQNVLIFSKRVAALYEVLRKFCNRAFVFTGEIISLNLIEEILPV